MFILTAAAMFVLNFLCGMTTKNTKMITQPENTHLLCKGKYNCMEDLMFDFLGFSFICLSLIHNTFTRLA